MLELTRFSEFYGTKKQLFPHPEKAAEILLGMIEKHVFLIAKESDGTPCGFIAGFLAPHFFNPDITVLTEIFWWVDEHHRNTRAGAVLLADFVNYGKLKADWITLCLVQQSPVKEESILKRGFRRTESSFLMEV